MRIASNHLTEDLMTQEPTLSITSNLVTSIGEVIITADDEIYQTKMRQIRMIKRYYSNYTGQQIDEAVKAIADKIELDDLHPDLVTEIKK